MPLFRRVCLSLLLVVPLLPNCVPDFDALSSGIVPVSGTGPTGGGGKSTGGSSGSVGTSGTADGATGGTSVGGGDAGSAAGGAPVEAAGMGGDFNAGGAVGAGGEPSPSGGSGGEPGCSPAAAGVTVFNGFDGGLEGPGFTNGAITADVHTTLKSTSSALWDSQEGDRCAGSLRLSCAFKAYASGTADDEKAFVSYFFDRRDWSEATALHAMVRVSPTAPPIAGVRLFVLSGDNYLYTSVLDDTAFKSGGWNQMTLPLQAGTYYDPTNVHRIGVEVALLRADAPGIPSTPPVVDVWVDDLWLEPK